MALVDGGQEVFVDSLRQQGIVLLALIQSSWIKCIIWQMLSVKDLVLISESDMARPSKQSLLHVVSSS